jgi:DNA polymerase elongation subunit (family B)
MKDAAIFAEFGKVVCISAGYIYNKKGKEHLKLKSFYNDDESILLNDFSSLLASWNKLDRTLCGHNIKEFDIPYIARRMLINGIPLPDMLNIAGKKPWEVQFLDTLELWKFGDYKNFTSLNLLTAVFDIPTPKDDIDGSMVGSVYYETGDLKRIASFCEKDVIATTQE